MRYTLAVTSCNRFPLLQRTLDSFLRYADVLPEVTIIQEDSGAAQPEWLSHPKYWELGRGVWKANGTRRGQIATLDNLYSQIETPYVFHLEDDWEFTRGGFIAPSFRILEKHPEISCVSVRGNDCNGHPLSREMTGGNFQVQLPGWQGGWGGYSFNPGLRRLEDLKHFGGSLGRFAGYGTHGCGHELAISKRMLDLGYRIAVLDEKPHCKHIGAGVSRATEPLPKAPRILLAVPVTQRYDYGTHTSGIKRETAGRIEAVRDTWMRDAGMFPNVTACFFYGNRTLAPHARNTDSVHLDCPDDYTRLPEKVRKVCRYAVDGGYDFLIKADDDSILYLDRLLRSGFDLVDQMGCFPCKHVHYPKCRCYATGMCYTLSRRALELVANAPLPVATDPIPWAEDHWVGRVLRDNGIKPVGHPGWTYNPNSHYINFPLQRNAVVAHSVRPADMRKWYAELTGAAAKLQATHSERQQNF